MRHFASGLLPPAEAGVRSAPGLGQLVDLDDGMVGEVLDAVGVAVLVALLVGQHKVVDLEVLKIVIY